ncbi:hypothetical protein D3C85_1874740 [compost metagenome]
MSAAIRCTFGFCSNSASKALAFGSSASRSMPKSFFATPHANGTLYRKYRSATLRLSPAT